MPNQFDKSKLGKLNPNFSPQEWKNILCNVSF